MKSYGKILDRSLEGLQAMNSFHKSSSDSTSIEAFRARYNGLEAIYTKFHHTVNEIETLPAKELPDAKINLSDRILEFDELYYDLVAIFNYEIKRRDNQNLETGNHTIENTLKTLIANQSTFLHNMENIQSRTPSDIKLPNVIISPFGGDYRDWKSFYDLYNATIHTNAKLSDVSKFKYLKTVLKDDAAQLIKHIEITEAGYEEAWKKVVERYSNTNHIINAYIKTFINQPKITHLCASTLRKLTDVSDEVIRGLKALGPEAENRDNWLVYLVTEKLDLETRRKWALETASVQYPSFDRLITFLNTHCFALESCSSNEDKASYSQHKSKSIKGFVSSANTLSPAPLSSSSKCCVCSGSHRIYQCEKFHGMSVNAREQLIKTQSLCFNCLSAGHMSNQCKSTRTCNHCKKRHHSLLHHAPVSPQVSNANASMLNPFASQFDSNTPLVPASRDLTVNHSTIPSRTSFNSSDNTGSSINTSSINSSAVKSSPLNSFPINTLLSNQESSPHIPTIATPALTEQQDLLAVLPTAVVLVLDSRGHQQYCRVMLDSGSQATFITESCMQRLSLDRIHSRICINGLSSSSAGTTRGKATLNVSSRHSSDKFCITAFVLTKITANIPSHNIKVTKSHHNMLQKLPLADPEFAKPNQIDILIGADYIFDILEYQTVKNQENKVIAINSKFGWVVSGTEGCLKADAVDCVHAVTSLHTQLSIDQELRRFWEIEDVPSTRVLTEDERDAEDQFVNSITQQSDGKFMVKLPFNSEGRPLGNSLNSAMSRLVHMERRFQHNSALKSAYHEFMQEYIDLKHMEVIPTEAIPKHESSVFYLPHHAVFKESSTTTKLRVVFDGSCKTNTGMSLNDKLLKGYALQDDIFSILTRFRKHRYALSADIEKMYRQVWVHPDHQDYQRVVWRWDPSMPFQHFRLKTVTYGTTAGAFLAIRALQQVAKLHESTNPLASTVIANDFYVDDLMTGANTIQDALLLKDQLCKVLETNGFNLRKWCSNSNVISSTKRSLDINDSSSSCVSKVLGIYWNSAIDVFSFKVNLSTVPVVTKRKLLSETARIFDPLGWLAPTTITLKIMFQQLWSPALDVSWDDPLPSHIAEKWTEVRRTLTLLEKIRIPRWIGIRDQGIQIHGFSDASESAYAAVVYLRTPTTDNSVSVNLIAAKTKVAPTSQLSLPRLELCGALLLAQLLRKVVNSLGDVTAEMWAWTDSTIVLSWLSDCPRRWQTFVANRAAKILDIVPRNHWNHVPTQDNPADCASRGITPMELISHDLWWTGPQWLRQSSDYWPSLRISTIGVNVPEARSALSHVSQTLQEEPEILLKYSSWSKLVQIVALCLRYINNSRNQLRTGKITIKESIEAQSRCIRLSQISFFKDEITCINKAQPIRSSSNLLTLNPFLDDNRIMRVGGRLELADLRYNVKHPIILSNRSYISTLIIREMHSQYLHAGSTFLLTQLRQKYWITGAKNLIKNVIRNCVTCRRYTNQKSEQLMGNIPAQRIEAVRPFLRVGCDYAGPIIMKLHSGRCNRTCKSYIAIFICMSTKAMHIEIVSDLTTAAFLSTLRRFISRRGLPSDIYSDNGTNFVGANRDLNELQQFITSMSQSNVFYSFFSQHSINWHFIPPSSPHFGGLWESNIKSIKLHLKRVIGDTKLTYEEMATLTTQIEGILNSRPLCLTAEGSAEPLTPAHFLIGQPITMLPEHDLTPVPISHVKRWELVQRMIQGFWQRWKSEYLTTLNQRSKWSKRTTNFQDGDVVIIIDSNTPSAK